MAAPGKNNLITDVPGIKVGHATDETVKTGVTVLRCAEQFVCAVDVRGAAPGSRETDVLDTENLVGKADAIVLSGGSVFGLAAADGVTDHLSSSGVGLTISAQGPAIPIVPAAVLHDLANDGDKNWGTTSPYRALGISACEASAETFALGSFGAGRGAMAGVMKGGIGSASIVLENNIVVGALVAVNPVGSVTYPDGKTFYAWPWEVGNEFGGQAPPSSGDNAEPVPPLSRLAFAKPGANTTIAIVATNADLTRPEAKRIAIMAHDGFARAIRPAHTQFDGDTIFSVATGSQSLPAEGPFGRPYSVSMIGSAAADCLARAIARGVYAAA